MTSKLPVVAITMGDPSGVGPEVILKALAHPCLYDECRPLVVGSVQVFHGAAQAMALASGGAGLHWVESAGDASDRPERIAILDVPVDMAGVAIGVEGPESGRAAVESVRAAVMLALDGEADAIATAPLNKRAMRQAGFTYAGHTELIAELTGTRDYAMMLVTPKLRVVHVSTHVGLREAVDSLNAERILTVIGIAHETLIQMGIGAPRIAVAGLNPHAGEGGIFGSEEIEIIEPAVRQARARGYDATGPFPPDTVFYRASQGEFDIVVAMYHDQGHIPIKLSGFETGVNVSVGMPFPRTSVDHGTAFDIAGRGIASESSMVEAILLAARMTRAGER
jgi:4-hydroxythreonine-4-phosphate dehydrogenase